MNFIQDRTWMLRPLPLIFQPRFMNYQLIGDTVAVMAWHSTETESEEFFPFRMGNCNSFWDMKTLLLQLQKNTPVAKRVILSVGYKECRTKDFDLQECMHTLEKIINFLRSKKVTEIILTNVPPCAAASWKPEHWKNVQDFNYMMTNFIYKYTDTSITLCSIFEHFCYPINYHVSTYMVCNTPSYAVRLDLYNSKARNNPTKADLVTFSKRGQMILAHQLHRVIAFRRHISLRNLMNLRIIPKKPVQNEHLNLSIRNEVDMDISPLNSPEKDINLEFFSPNSLCLMNNYGNAKEPKDLLENANCDQNVTSIVENVRDIISKISPENVGTHEADKENIKNELSLEIDRNLDSKTNNSNLKDCQQLKMNVINLKTETETDEKQCEIKNTLNLKSHCERKKTVEKSQPLEKVNHEKKCPNASTKAISSICNFAGKHKTSYEFSKLIEKNITNKTSKTITNKADDLNIPAVDVKAKSVIKTVSTFCNNISEKKELNQNSIINNITKEKVAEIFSSNKKNKINELKFNCGTEIKTDVLKNNKLTSSKKHEKKKESELKSRSSLKTNKKETTLKSILKNMEKIKPYLKTTTESSLNQSRKINNNVEKEWIKNLKKNKKEKLADAYKKLRKNIKRQKERKKKFYQHNFYCNCDVCNDGHVNLLHHFHDLIKTLKKELNCE